MQSIVLTVNGQAAAGMAEPRTHLADFLRNDLGLTGTHLGCEQGVCGACTVLIDGAPQRSCIAYAVDCDGSTITTIEGFDDDPTMAALREAFSEHHALQCGFCTPGMLMTARDIVLRLGEIPETRIREELSGNLCRCTGYVGIVGAVGAVCAGRTAGATTPPAPVAARVAVAAVESVSAPLRAPDSGARDATPIAATGGGTEIEERIAIAADPDAVWAALADLRRVAGCLPGAELDSLDGGTVTGRMRVALGPIKAAFAGEGQVARDEAARTGRMTGRGRDGGSGSSAEGEVRWQVLPGESAGSVLAVSLRWRLTGALAQFSRGSLVRDVVRRLAADFAANLQADIAGGPGAAPVQARPLGLFALLWSVLKARLFGRG